MNLFKKIGILIFQILASILIILALLLEHLSQIREKTKKTTKNLGNEKRKTNIHQTPLTHSLS
ncbi:hypothetical protein PXD04_01355 [Methanosphaera sp. ISO3-F5]|uniref:hypothetical protein n=1 Tax=Methanosphaera sp. ISO3-F5 TaxID=1452353 RepID=UPI002B25965A|nr:hypothetical protein [Methanosphaera sp. ISO3-F5]WQH64472.1 hypothetical protein PXD04_01355 [Methanosphaera sp. ISO3-F5]